jgi:hypothetical protein
MEERSAGMFCVEKVRELFWLTTVPIGRLTAEVWIAVTTWEGTRLKYWSLFGSRRTMNWRVGAPSMETLATPDTRSSAGVSVFCT